MSLEIIFSQKAFVALLAEVNEYITTETGGIFLGHREENIWYVTEVIDPGFNATRTPAFFEYDDIYINHLMNVVDSRYKTRLEILGLWHRHPGSFDSFSTTDDETNLNFASKHSTGAISALVNIDPVFRLTVYHVTTPLNYTKIKYKVGDKYIPEDYLSSAEINALIRKINIGSTQRQSHVAVEESAVSNTTGKKHKHPVNLIKNILERFIRTDNEIQKDISEEPDDSLEIILAELDGDIEAIRSSGRDVELLLSDTGDLQLVITEPSGNEKQIMTFYMIGNKIYFKHDYSTYVFKKNRFKEAII